MERSERFWNLNIAVSMTVAFVVVAVTALNVSRDDAGSLALLAFPVIGAGAISHAITNRTFVYWPPWPWKKYKYTAFERWSLGLGSAVFVSVFLVDMLLKHGQ
jgi:hypothetical protein